MVVFGCTAVVESSSRTAERDMLGDGFIIVWQASLCVHKTDMARIAGSLNTVRYRNEIIRRVLLTHIQSNGPMVFMQDNARIHTA